MTGKVYQLRTMEVHAALLRRTITRIVWQLIDLNAKPCKLNAEVFPKRFFFQILINIV